MRVGVQYEGRGVQNEGSRAGLDINTCPISQWLPCPLAIWAFGFDGKSC